MSDRDIGDITSKTNLLHADLQRLFHALDMSDPEIENAERSADSKDATLRARKVLKAWRMKDGVNACRRRILDALLECGLVDAKETLEKKWSLVHEGKTNKCPVIMMIPSQGENLYSKVTSIWSGSKNTPYNNHFHAILVKLIFLP